MMDPMDSMASSESAWFGEDFYPNEHIQEELGLWVPSQRPSWVEVLHQDLFWWNRENETIPMWKIDERYATNIMNWLIERAEEIKWAVDMWWVHQEARGEAAQDGLDMACDEVWNTKAEDYVRDSELFKRLWRKVTGA